jgi:hypothetical protein
MCCQPPGTGIGVTFSHLWWGDASKPWCNALEALNLTKNATTKPSEWERGEGELYKGVWTIQSAKRASPTSAMEYICPSFPLLAVMGKTVPRGPAMPSRTVLIWIPTVKTRSQRLSEVVVGLGGLSARTPRTVRVGPADGPREDRGPSTRSTELHAVLFGFEENNGPPAWGPRTVCLEAHFLENFCQKTQI